MRNEMKLYYALQETGCAISVDGECITSVERLTDGKYLRGVSILQCHFTTPDELEKRYEHEVWEWEPARVVFVPYQ